MKCFGSKIRNFHCKVVLLDDQELIQEVQGSSSGHELVENVFKHLNIIETSYFGLRFVDNSGQTHWLDPGKKLIKQLEDTEPFTLYFGVKFYAADPCRLLEEITRYQFYLQIKQDILQGRLLVPLDVAAELGAYSIQSELGDYDPRRHSTGYISEFRFVSNQSSELEAKIAELHKTMIGQVPAVAELNYLEKVKWLDMYGVDLHPVLGEDSTDYFLGLTPSGIVVLRNKTKVGNYFWPRISKVHHKGKYFMIKVKSKTNDVQTYGFETPSKGACKHLWKCAIEHHNFFRLVQVAPVATLTSGKKSSTLNSRFRDSTRSESSVRRRAQPEFVRTPSRRYTRRVVEGGIDTMDAACNGENSGPNLTSKNKPDIFTHSNSNVNPTPTVNQLRSDSPRSIGSAPWPSQYHKRAPYSAPSPRSVRSEAVGETDWCREGLSQKERKRSASAESQSSVDSRSHRRHRHGRGRKSSDVDSEVSRSSGRSRHSKRRSRNGSCHRDSGSDSDGCHHHKHRHRHKHSEKYELVDSEVQWREVQKKQEQIKSQGSVQQVAVISSASASVTRSSHSQDLDSSMVQGNRRRAKRSHRSKSKEKLPDEVKKHIDFHLIDTDGMTQDELKEIPYTRIETNACGVANKSRSVGNTKLLNRNTPSEHDAGALKYDLPSSGDSPPPPYSPPEAEMSSRKTKPIKEGISITSGRDHTANLPEKNVTTIPDSSDICSLTHHPDQALRKVPPVKQFSRSINSCGLPGFEKNEASYPVYHQRNHGRNRSRLAHVDVSEFHLRSPSESPDSQNLDFQPENSDSGLGTDHPEYYRSMENNNSRYCLPETRRLLGEGTSSTTFNNLSEARSRDNLFWNINANHTNTERSNAGIASNINWMRITSNQSHRSFGNQEETTPLNSSSFSITGKFSPHAVEPEDSKHYKSLQNNPTKMLEMSTEL